MANTRPQIDLEKLTEEVQGFNNALKRLSEALKQVDENLRKQDALINKMLDGKR